jgi:hypothetical protein
MKHKVLKVNPKDNVIVALANLSKGDTISFEGEEYILQDNINAKHKFFTKDLNTGDEIIMYGVLVGKAQSFIPRGGLMTTQIQSMLPIHLLIVLQNMNGMLRMFQNSKEGLLMVIIEVMGE